MDSPPRPPANLTVAFNHNQRSPSVARRAVRHLVDENDPAAWAVELVTSELVANVIQHTTGGGVVRAWARMGGDPVRVEVSDPHPEVLADPGAAFDDCGYGLMVVDGLADAWGIDIHPGGKTIWAELG